MLPERTDADAASDAMSEGVPPAAEAPESTTVEKSAAAESSSGEATETATATATPPNEVVVADAAAGDVTTAAPTEVIATATPAVEVVAVKATAEPEDPHAWDGPSIPFVPHHALTEGVMALAFLTVMFALVATVPADLEARANPFLSPTGVMPEWYLVPPFELLHLVPALPGMLGVGVAVGILLMWPFIDRKPRRLSRRPFVMILAFSIIAILVGLSVYSYMHAAG
jgi:hypothetical protein